jgi:hypothetical protein
VEPQWKAFPDFARESIAWRMGPGEDYFNGFYRWFSGLDASSREHYMRKHPHPKEWDGFYQTIIDHPWGTR